MPAISYRRKDLSAQWPIAFDIGGISPVPRIWARTTSWEYCPGSVQEETAKIRWDSMAHSRLAIFKWMPHIVRETSDP
jgi:hypothetical protein